jgi:hypothetical protein
VVEYVVRVLSGDGERVMKREGGGKTYEDRIHPIMNIFYPIYEIDLLADHRAVVP